jgi:hypothetical protein
MYPQADLRYHPAGSQPSFEKPVQLGKGKNAVPGIFLNGAGTDPHQFTRGKHHLHTGDLFAVQPVPPAQPADAVADGAEEEQAEGGPTGQLHLRLCLYSSVANCAWDTPGSMTA